MAPFCRRGTMTRCALSWEGHNWWCVLFPQLCIGTAAEGPELEQIEKLAEGPEYRLSFALVEWLERLLSAGKETAIS